MLKLFFKFYLVIAIPLILLFVPSMNPGFMLIESWANDLYARELKDIFYLLDSNLAEVPERDWSSRIDKLNKYFGNSVAIKKYPDLKLAEKKQQRVKAGEIVLNLRGLSRLYKQYQDTDWVWVVNLDMTIEQKNDQLIRGPVYLMNQKLSHYPQAQWQAIIQQQVGKSDVPVTLVDVDTLPDKVRENPRLGWGKLVREPLDRALNNLYMQSADPGSVYKFGPVDERDFEDRAGLMNRLLPASLLAFGILLLAVPLWQDIRKLRRDSDALGQGDFSVRTQLGRGSVLSPLAQAFNHMAEKVQHLMEGHKALTNAVSHELKTPVSRLRFSLELLQDHPDELDKQRYFGNIERDISELEALISELLIHARYDRARPLLNRQRLDIGQWISHCVEDLKDYFPNLVFDIQLPMPAVYAEVDEKSLTRVMNNLLNNATRYAHSVVQVAVLVQEKRLILRVDDDGPGVPEAERQHIFEPFVRLDKSRHRNTGGSGLGLAIVEKIVEWHNGTVSCQASSLGGARFQIEFPC